MNTYHLAVVGIALLALSLVVDALGGGLSALHGILEAHARSGDALDEVAESLFRFLALLIALGLLPAAILIVFRRSIARRWFVSDGSSEVEIAPHVQLLRLGLVLLGVVMLANGLSTALTGGVIGAFTLSGGEMVLPLRGHSLGMLAGGVVHLAFGIALIRRSAPWATRWAGEPSTA